MYRKLQEILSGRVNELGSYLEDKDYLSYVKRLKGLKNSYLNKRCFIIGNGPSLNNLDLRKLKNEYTFGLNRIYLLRNIMGYYPTFYVAVNTLLIKQFGKEVSKVSSLKFINWDAREYLVADEKTMFIKPVSNVEFSVKLHEGLWFDSTVTFVAMQIAYFLGFKEIVLIGVDHDFKTKGPADKIVVSKGGDKSHFSSSYFGKGIKWQLPDLEGSELAYKMAKWQFEKNGGRIINATVGGKLDIFPKVKYESLFNKK